MTEKAELVDPRRVGDTVIVVLAVGLIMYWGGDVDWRILLGAAIIYYVVALISDEGWGPFGR